MPPICRRKCLSEVWNTCNLTVPGKQAQQIGQDKKERKCSKDIGCIHGSSAMGDSHEVSITDDQVLLGSIKYTRRSGFTLRSGFNRRTGLTQRTGFTRRSGWNQLDFNRQIKGKADFYKRWRICRTQVQVDRCRHSPGHHSAKIMECTREICWIKREEIWDKLGFRGPWLAG